MLADGSLHLRRRANDTIDNVAESVTVRASKDTAWPHIGTLMKLLADPRLAFWKVELALEPESDPVQTQTPR